MGIGSLTEHLSEYVDLFLKPLVVNLPSYIEDTTDVLTKLLDVEWDPSLMFATFDVVGLYTCIENKLGQIALPHYLSKRSASLTEHSKMILEMCDFILQNNVFLFKDEWYHQIKGTAMGSRFAPSYANLFMGWFEREHAWSPRAAKSTDNVIFWGHFIDDILIIWRGDDESPKGYVEYLNDNSINVSLTNCYSKTQIDYLDVRLYIGDNKIQSKLYMK